MFWEFKGEVIVLREMLEFITGSIAVIGIFFLPLPLVVAGVVVGWWFLSKFGIVRRFPIESYFRSVDIIVPFLVPLTWMLLTSLLPFVKKGFYNIVEISVLGLCWGVCMILRILILRFRPVRYSLCVNLTTVLLFALDIVCALVIPGYGLDN